jgi:8-oxo-dGTP pyrophosphatase MutT (NUDIX family)
LSTPARAATVLLLDDRPEGLSVFMVQRSLTSSFMPGAYVFPGGKVEPDEDARGWSGLDAAAARFRGELEDDAARACLIAAAREVHEESGVRLPGLEQVRVWSHWITPAVERKRFDTWFLVAPMPHDADPGHDEQEVIASRWVQPKAAVERYGSGDLLLAPPTYYTLWELAKYGAVEEVLDAASRRPLPPIQPRFETIDEAMALVLPGDERYPAERPVDGPTRIVMGGGRWWLAGGLA